jgi:hypothetical protein
LVRSDQHRLCGLAAHRGRERAAAERLDIEFREADVEALPFADGGFDAVVSTFGCMFAPNSRARGQRDRRWVLSPAARSAWRTGRPTASSASCSRPSASTSSRRQASSRQALWGSKALDELFGPQASAIDAAAPVQLPHRSPDHWLEIFKTFYGPVLKAFGALDAAAQPSWRAT